jgi:hypothetical protein
MPACKTVAVTLPPALESAFMVSLMAAKRTLQLRAAALNSLSAPVATTRASPPRCGTRPEAGHGRV